MKKYLVVALIWWGVLTACYLLLADKLAASEIGAGVLAAAVATTALMMVRAQGIQHFAPRWSWNKHLRKIPATVLADSWVLAIALWRQLARGERIEGAFRAVPFDAGGDDPQAAARRALVTAGVTLGPNTYVITIHGDKNILAVHQLLPSRELPGNCDREWPL